jgi:tetratricopeptide (TPR) repeat protein
MAVALAGLALLAWLGWITVQGTRADMLARDEPEAALRIDPDHPQALLSLAWKQLDAKRYDAASATARDLLAVEPGQGDAFAVLALAAVARGDRDAPRLLAIALQRAPRDRNVRVQAALAGLKAGDLREVLAQIDALLRLSPERGETLFPLLAQQAQDQAFAAMLVDTLARHPPWRARFLVALAGKGIPPGSMDNIYGGLQAKGELPAPEVARWLDRMLAEGRWGEAFARWVGTLGPGVRTIPPVRNGDFERDVSGIGFGWRNDPVKGVFAAVEPGAGVGGSRGAHLHFIGQAARGNLRQPLLLAPGRYRLSLQARADFLRTDQGLQWAVQCAGGPVVATLDGLDGSFGWRVFATDFEIPEARCPGQWLELRNPAVAGSARQVGGDLWFDDVAIVPDRAGAARRR